MRAFVSIILLFQFLLLAQPEEEYRENLFEENRFFKHLEFLGSDSLQGRGTGSRGNLEAAEYIAAELLRLGLTPLGNTDVYPESDSNEKRPEQYLQYIPMHGSKTLKTSKLRWYLQDSIADFQYGEDYVLFQTGEKTFRPQPLKLVFVGYGIIAPEYDYNDYQSVDVEGRIVVFLDGEPHSDSEEFFAGDLPTFYSLPESKVRTAMLRGAAGSILLPNTETGRFLDWEETKRAFSFEHINLAYSPNSTLSILFNPAQADMLFRGSGHSLMEIYRMHSENRIHSFELPALLSFKGEFLHRDFLSPNVIGMLEGSDEELKNTYVLFSAHFDHLGIGMPVRGDSIYNGVFDNAAGTAALLQLAEAFSKSGHRNKRSIIFLFTTGEEHGLLGSRYYTDHPPVPLYRTVANINIDGIASFDEFNSIIPIGAGYSTLSTFIEDAAARNQLSITGLQTAFVQTGAFDRSDQIAFAQAGIPSVLISEGIDFKHLTYREGLGKLIHYSENVYHTPFDDLSIPINYKAVRQHLKLLYDAAELLASSEETPEWNPGVPHKRERLRSIAEKR